MIAFIRGVFMDGTLPSFSRVASGFIVFVCLSLVTFVTLKDGRLPDMGGITAFATATLAALYTGNKIAAAIEAK